MLFSYRTFELNFLIKKNKDLNVNLSPLHNVAGVAGWARCTSPLRRRKCGDTSVSPAPPCQTYFLVGSNPPFNPNKKTTHKGWLFYWLGWQDSNLRMSAPKADALPLGDTPTSFSLLATLYVE